MVIKMGEISFSYNQAKNNQILISKQNQGLGYLSTYLPYATPTAPAGGPLNLYTDGSTYYPSTVSSPGSNGQLSSDGNYIYYGAGINNWVRVSMADW
jgi:hypothetical protein